MELVKKTYSSDNIIIRYYELGHGEDLLFFHGAGLSALSYKENLEFLSKSFHVIAPDIPGFGKSGMPPPNFDFSKSAAHFKKFISHLRLKKYILVGYSFGGG